MSDLTTLEDQRLRRIREESLKAYDPKMGYVFSKRPSWNDINYLLSWINENQIGRSRSFNDWIGREDFGIKSRNQLQRCWSDAATAMRDKCVEKMKETLISHAPACGNAIYCDCGAQQVRNELLAALEKVEL